MPRPTIHEDLLQTLKLWRGGKEIHSLELGHTQRIDTRPDETQRIDIDHVHRNDQAKIHEWTFYVIEHFVEAGAAPESFEEFSAVCDQLEREEMPELVKNKKLPDLLTREELDGAESLAWKAMLVGWNRAIHGHDKDVKYATLKSTKKKKHSVGRG